MAGTGVEVRVGTGVGTDAWVWNIGDYSVSEDATPLDPSDQTGGYGQIEVDVPDVKWARRMQGRDLYLSDGSEGEISGTIRNVQGDGTGASVTANSRIALTAVERTIQPFVGTLGTALEYHLGLCGITSGIVIDTGFYSIPVKIPGGRENVYDRLKKLGAAYLFEMSLVSNDITFRPPRQREAVTYRDSEVTWALDQNNMAQTVTGYYYNTWSGTDLAYPVDRQTNDADVYQVDAGETKQWRIPMNASLSAVQQPTCVQFVGLTDFTASVYAVATAEGSQVDPSQWISAGGNVAVSVDEDTTTLVISITGANLPELSPFRIAVPTGDNQYYSSLRVRGTGVFWDKELMTLYVSDDPDFAPDEIGTQLDSPFMETKDQLYHRMLKTMERYGTDAQTIQVTSAGINRLGESGSVAYPTIGDVAAAYPGATISSIYTSLGPTIADWNAALYDMVRSDFTNQAFGNIAGARVRYDDTWYRIRTARISPDSISYSGERDNTIKDVYRTDETISDWNARWTGLTVRDVNINPLQGITLDPAILANYPSVGLFPAINLYPGV